MAPAPAKAKLVVEPIPPAQLQQIRAAGADERGNWLIVQADTRG